MASTIKEALSVVSEDQSLFECAYGSPHLVKTEMTASSSSEYGQTSKMSPRVPQQDWLSQPPARVTIKMECNPNQVNGSRNSPDDCSVAKGGKMVSSSDSVGMNYGNYMEEKHIPPPNMTTNERRVIVPADPTLWSTDHVRQWLEWAVKEYGLPDVDILLFQNIDGKELCKMTKDDFQRLTPSYNADILLSHLHYLRETPLPHLTSDDVDKALQNSPRLMHARNTGGATFIFPNTSVYPEATQRIATRPDLPYEQARRSAWTSHSHPSPQSKATQPSSSTVPKTEDQRPQLDPYQILGPTSSRLANPGLYITFGRQWADPAVAVPAGAAVGQLQLQLHHLGGHQRRVQDDGPRRGGAALGRAEEQAQHELRQAEPRPALLLRQEHHDQGARQALRLQIRLPRHRPGAAASPPGVVHVQIPVGPALHELVPRAPAEDELCGSPPPCLARDILQLFCCPQSVLEFAHWRDLPQHQAASCSYAFSSWHLLLSGVGEISARQSKDASHWDSAPGESQ
ncbi:transcriptional regulator ERG isoform X3 [Anomalospiza imberbis]|uniref:transcriptional regulator ERG isoform X3 n=1 Tax=Anomalospiza imberbis TaxID=187417 RepID=UPI00358E5C2A